MCCKTAPLLSSLTANTFPEGKKSTKEESVRRDDQTVNGTKVSPLMLPTLTAVTEDVATSQ